MKLKVLILLFLAFLSCKDVTESTPNKSNSDRIELPTESDKVEKQHLKNLTSLLEHPIDLQKFKKSKNKVHSTTGVSIGADYYYVPKIRDSIFYTYNYPSENFNESKRIDQIVVFKYGKNKHRYEDETEILIEMRIFNNDLDLEKANLIGLSKTELESEFGVNYLTFGNQIVYSSKNKIMLLEIDNSIVKSYRYIKLNTEKIESDLIEQIIK